MSETIDWRQAGVDAAHCDSERAGMATPCTTIEDARRRCSAWLRSQPTPPTDEEIEACAQGYLAGWTAMLADWAAMATESKQ